ncbi:hypothetical protein TIFTF001_029531 [Ficus carica]|uniref:Uncharacterized protein n=1 Tax=Ficus carica TaxID=3494 RepID=A0AA88DRQ8_FICCA|nr:hypothetical protein TIFTF001_029531 [Ficus carica]
MKGGVAVDIGGKRESERHEREWREESRRRKKWLAEEMGFEGEIGGERERGAREILLVSFTSVEGVAIDKV